jgi:DNA polymerase III delta prime subunit
LSTRQQHAVLQRGAGDAMMANAESPTLMDARIILVEGFPGCGKSTTAQWLARQFRAAGPPAEWFYEGQRPHPMLAETPTPAALASTLCRRA